MFMKQCICAGQCPYTWQSEQSIQRSVIHIMVTLCRSRRFPSLIEDSIKYEKRSTRKGSVECWVSTKWESMLLLAGVYLYTIHVQICVSTFLFIILFKSIVCPSHKIVWLWIEMCVRHFSSSVTFAIFPPIIDSAIPDRAHTAPTQCDHTVTTQLPATWHVLHANTIQ